MNLRFIKLDESHDAMECELASPEEFQAYKRAMSPQIPEGYAYVVTQGTSPMKRPTLTLALVKIGTQPTLGPVVAPRVDAPTPLNVPDVVKNATDAQLEEMAGKAGIEITPAWKNRNRALRETSVAKKMALNNTR